MSKEEYLDVTIQSEKNTSHEGLFGKKNNSVKLNADDTGLELARMKKTELLEIMLAQGREIDSLRKRVSELETQLEKRELDFERIGSLAEASIYLSDLFKEADKVVETFVKNVKRKYE